MIQIILITYELIDILLPDRDNTFLALLYSEGGVISPNPSEDPTIQLKAQNLMKLVGLDKNPGKSLSDRRWSNR